MAFLTISGIDLPVADGGITSGFVYVGDRGRVWDGAYRKHDRRLARKWTVTTTPLTNDEQINLLLLLSGYGWHFPFDATGGVTDEFQYAVGKGTGASAIDAAVASSAANPKYGARHLRIPAAGPVNEITWALGLGAWTAMVWRSNPSGGAYGHYLETSTGLYFTDGVAGAQEAWFTGGGFTLKGHAVNEIDFDDLVVLSIAVTAAQAPGLYTTHAAGAWANNPELLATGDYLSALFSAGATVVCEVKDAPYLQAGGAGGWDNALRVLQFTMEEV